MNKFNYAITGVSGFVGSNLVARLLVEENTKTIYILTENSEKLKSQYSDFNNVVILNRDIENLAKHILKIDIFFMLGWGGSRGELRESYDVQKSSFDYNCRLLAVSKKWGVNKVIFSGSQAEYGLTSKITSEKFDEKPITNYGKSKLRFKNYATSFCKDNGIKYAHLRFYSLYGHDFIPFSGRVYDHEEILNLVDASLDFWVTSGPYSKQFESDFADFMQQKYCLLVNSGSSANLVAFSSLTSPMLGERRILPGSEVITVAAGFPTTVAPIIQNNCVPVFVDVDIETLNINVDLIEAAITEKTRAIMIAHTLGNPFDVKRIRELADKYKLWIVEDCCDAVGSTVDGKMVGTFGDIATVSFYPAHHMTMGEGGAVLTNNSRLFVAARSIRDWGRDCYCEPGMSNTCGRRFNQQHGDLPFGYDHKYVYSHIGYNLKVTDLQAAIGVAQLKKLNSFIEKRIDNYEFLHQGLKKYNNLIIFPKVAEGVKVSWFGFPITLNTTLFNRNELVKHLEENGIMTRLLFAGNLTKQPAFKDVNFRMSGELINTDKVMQDTLFVGVYPGINETMRKKMLDVLVTFLNKYNS
jgi:CDP-4-dehydro-6-deoxyglucose reductase, E1